MSDEERKAGERGAATAAASVPSEQPYFDEHTTEPNAPAQVTPPKPPAPGNWQMPKPKFQQTSGRLPQGYVKPPAPVEDAVSEEALQASPPLPKADAAPPDVEPQPELNEIVPEEPAPDNIAQAPSAKSGPSFSLVALAVGGALLLLAIFLVVVYFLFLANPSGGNNF